MLPTPSTDPAQAPLILGLGGTLRAGSSSEIALRIALSSAERRGARTVLLNGNDLTLPLYDPGTSERTPAAQRLVTLMAQCAGVIIASPGYHGSISGLVKNALDYCEDLRCDQRPYLESRAAGCIVCAYGWQATGTTLVALRSIVHALRGWPTPLGVAINSALTRFGADGSCPDQAVTAQLEMVGTQVTEFALSRRAGNELARVS